MSSDSRTNFYCNQKFNWLSIDLEKRLSYSCCSAEPTKVNVNWHKSNPGKLFNTPELVDERQDMLNNKAVSSCSSACWVPEAQGLPSRRVTMNSDKKTHTDVIAQPETLNIITGSQCNLTCSYCSKQYSSAWRRDIKDNGVYLANSILQPIDLLLEKISQSEHYNSVGAEVILSEFKYFTNLKKIYITGGEPFLYNKLVDLLENINSTAEIVCYSGLGVNPIRFKTQLEKIKQFSNVSVCVSAENIDKFHEFNRYGNSYTTFQENFELLKASGIKIKIQSVISNLTIFGLVDFVKPYSDYEILYQFCNSPDYLNISVLDPTSKENLKTVISSSNLPAKDLILDGLSADPTVKQQEDCAFFLKEFARRRNLSLDIFPKSMLQWLSI